MQVHTSDGSSSSWEGHYSRDLACRGCCGQEEMGNMVVTAVGANIAPRLSRWLSAAVCALRKASRSALHL